MHHMNHMDPYKLYLSVFYVLLLLFVVHFVLKFLFFLCKDNYNLTTTIQYNQNKQDMQHKTHLNKACMDPYDSYDAYDFIFYINNIIFIIHNP